MPSMVAVQAKHLATEVKAKVSFEAQYSSHTLFSGRAGALYDYSRRW